MQKEILVMMVHLVLTVQKEKLEQLVLMVRLFLMAHQILMIQMMELMETFTLILLQIRFLDLRLVGAGHLVFL